MKEINKIIILLSIGCIMFSICSCKTASIVTFESARFERFKNGVITSEILSEEFYFTRILTATCVDIVIFKFSKKNNFEDIFVKNIVIIDDTGNKLFEKEKVLLTSNGILHSEYDCNYEIYSYEIPSEEFDKITFQNYKSNCILLSFEIDGTKYTEKLKRNEKKYVVTRT